MGTAWACAVSRARGLGRDFDEVGSSWVGGGGFGARNGRVFRRRRVEECRRHRVEVETARRRGAGSDRFGIKRCVFNVRLGSFGK